MAKVERDFMDPRSWSSHSKMSEAIMRQRVIKESRMLRNFGIPYEAKQERGDCPVMEGFKLAPIKQELLKFSPN